MSHTWNRGGLGGFVGLISGTLRRLFLVLVVGVLGACGGGDNVAPTATATIGVAGGTLHGPDGTLIAVPANALAAEVVLRVTRDGTGAPALPAGLTALSKIFTVTPHIEPFEVPVQVGVPIGTGVAGNTPVALAFARPNGDWEILPANVVNSMATATTIHFSYVVAVSGALVGGPIGVCYGSTCSNSNAQATGPVFELSSPSPLNGMANNPNVKLVDSPVTLTLKATDVLYNTYVSSCVKMRFSMRINSWVRQAGVWTHQNLPDVSEDVPNLPSSVAQFPIPLDASFNGELEVLTSQQCLVSMQGGGYFAPTPPEWYQLAILSVQIPATTAVVAPTLASTEPADQSVNVGASATFSVNPGGTGPFAYQWQRGGSNITGETASSYTLTNAQLSDSGAVFSVVVTNTAGSVPSRNATLTVTAPASANCTGSDGTGWCLATVPAGFGSTDAGGIAVAFASSSVGVAASNSSHLWRTLDGGLSWTKVPVVYPQPGYSVQVMDVSYANPSLLYAMVLVTNTTNSSRYEAINSSDNGTTWSNSPSFMTMPVFNSSVGIEVAGQAIAWTSDGGANWDQQDIGLVALGVPVFLDARTVLIGRRDTTGVSPGMTFLRSTDGGATWANLSNVPSSMNPNSMSFANVSTGIALDGTNPEGLARTTDGGLNWTTFSVNDTAGGAEAASLNSVKLYADGTGLTVGAGGQIARTTDFGATWQWVGQDWTTLGGSVDRNLSAIASPAPGVFVVVGPGVILRNTQAGVGP